MTYARDMTAERLLLDRDAIKDTSNFLYMMNTWALHSPNPLPVRNFYLFYEYLD